MKLAGFTGFADSKGAFFLRLAKNQKKEWFDAHKAEYEEGWQAPMKLLLEGVRTKIDSAYPHLELGTPHVMRIYRDVRFSKDKSPYKTWMGGGVPLARAQGTKMPEAPSALYFHVSPKECFGGAGMYMMDPQTLERFRKAILDDKRGRELAGMTAKLTKKGYRLASADTLKKPPKGIDPEHPRIELLKRKGLVVMFPDLPRGELTKAKLVDRLAKHARECAGVVEWIAFATAGFPLDFLLGTGCSIDWNALGAKATKEKITMSFIARWTITAKFGHKDTVIALCRKWNAEVGDSLGYKKQRVITGSIGACESRLELEAKFASLAELEKSWADMVKNPWHAQFGKEMEPHVVSGTNQWEIFRIVEE